MKGVADQKILTVLYGSLFLEDQSDFNRTTMETNIF